MTSIELSLWIEANYPITGMGRPRKPLHGVGANDADYMTTTMVCGKQIVDPAYSAWVSMLMRAYSERYQEKQPTYIGVTVCKEWHSFIAFRNWWLDNSRDGFQCDKDLLVIGNKEYSPDACIYVPSWLNKFTTDRSAARGELPIGVCLDRRMGKYQSHCSNPITGKRHGLGRFNTPEAAHSAWLKYKLELAAQLKPAMDEIDQRIYPNVVTIIKALS